MSHTSFHLSVPKGFNFRSVLYSHGWADLEPFRRISDTALKTVITVSARNHVAVHAVATSSRIRINLSSHKTVTEHDANTVKQVLRSMLRCDESLDEFYSLCNNEKHLRWVHRIGGGRLLRSATMFEDIVKMICTTNCSWALTKTIIHHLTTKLGTHVQDQMFTFPAPDAIAAASEQWLRKETSSGYRAPYLLELSRKIASGKLSVEHLRTEKILTGDLYKFLRSIKGVGHYATGNLLKLLGHYDYLGIDSWIRSQFSEIHNNGRKTSDTAIEKHYYHYGKWRGLVCWMEMTKHWHIENIV